MAICCAERAGSQSVVAIGPGVTVKPIAARAAVVAAFALRNGGRMTFALYGAPSAAKRAAVSAISYAEHGRGDAVQVGVIPRMPEDGVALGEREPHQVRVGLQPHAESKSVAGTPLARSAASVAGR